MDSNWLLKCENRWPGCTNANQDKEVDFVKFATSGAAHEAWRGYFLFRTHCERVFHLLSAFFEEEINEINKGFPSVGAAMRLAIFFTEHMSELWNRIDTNVPSNLGMGNAQRTAAEAFNDHNSFWGASIQFFVDIVSQADKFPDPRMAASAAEAFFSQALFSGGRAKPHVRWIIANALVQWKDVLIPRVFGVHPNHYALLGAVTQCLASAHRLDEAALIRESMSQFLLSVMRSNPELFYTVSIAASKVFNELIGATSVASPGDANALYTLKLTIMKSFEHYINSFAAEIDPNAECDLTTEQLLLVVQICCTTPFNPETTKKDLQRCVRILLYSRDTEAIQLGIGIMVEHVCLEQSPDSKKSIAELIEFICAETATILQSPINANCAWNRVLPAVMMGLRYFFVQTEEIPAVIFPNAESCPQFTESFVEFVITLLGEQAVSNNQHGCPKEDINGFEHRARAFITICTILHPSSVHKNPTWVKFGGPIAEATLAFLLNAIKHQNKLTTDSSIITSIEMVQYFDELSLFPVATKFAQTIAQLLSTPRWLPVGSRSIAHLLSLDQVAGSIFSDIEGIFSLLWNARPIWLQAESFCGLVLDILTKCIEVSKSTHFIIPENFLAQLAAQHELLSSRWFAQVLPLVVNYIQLRPQVSYQILTQEIGKRLARLFFYMAPTLKGVDDNLFESSAKAFIALCDAGQSDVIQEMLYRVWTLDSSESSIQIESISNFKESDFMQEMLKPLPVDNNSSDLDFDSMIQAPTQRQIKKWLLFALTTTLERSKYRPLLERLISTM